METLSFEDSLKILRSNSNADIERKLQAIRDDLESPFKVADADNKEIISAAPKYWRFVQKVESVEGNLDDQTERELQEMKVILRSPSSFEIHKQAFLEMGPGALEDQHFKSRLLDGFNQTRGKVARLQSLQAYIEHRLIERAAAAGRRKFA